MKEGSELSCLEQAAIWAKTAKNKVRSKGHFFYPWKDRNRYKGSNELDIFRQHTLTKVGGCNGRNDCLEAILPLGGLVSAGVVVFVHRKGRRIDQTV
jgi:hypothetical protein